MTPMVSICLPTLNAADYLEARVDSILGQTLGCWELIVCDSYSDDGTWERLLRLKGDARVRLFRVPRAGIYAGWNECLHRAQGQYVYVATADDTARPELLERMVEALEKNRDVDIAVCGFDFIDAQGRVMDPPPRGGAWSFYGDWLDRPHRRSGWLEFIVHTCLDISWTTITAVVFRRSLLQRTGLFRCDCGPLADKFWAMRSAVATDTVFIPDRLATWRWHEGQLSSRLDHHGWTSLVRKTADTLDECAVLLPGAWRADPAWRQRLLAGVRSEYWAAFGLDRHTARKHPARFLAGCARAMRREPAYLAARLLSGFSWSTSAGGITVAQARQLVADWDVPWPPQLISV